MFVRCIEHGRCGIKYGKKYKVLKTIKEDGVDMYYTIINEYGDKCDYYVWRFEVIEGDIKSPSKNKESIWRHHKIVEV